MKKEILHLSVDEDIVKKLCKLAGGERKIGAFVSLLVAQYELQIGQGNESLVLARVTPFHRRKLTAAAMLKCMDVNEFVSELIDDISLNQMYEEGCSESGTDEQ